MTFFRNYFFKMFIFLRWSHCGGSLQYRWPLSANWISFFHDTGLQSAILPVSAFGLLPVLTLAPPLAVQSLSISSLSFLATKKESRSSLEKTKNEMDHIVSF